MNDIDALNEAIRLLVFEKDGGVIKYTFKIELTHRDEVHNLFIRALSGLYAAEYCDTASVIHLLEEKERAFKLEKTEALLDIIFGCSKREIDKLKRDYQLDLRENGYYLFFWELRRLEYLSQYRNKSVFIFLGRVIEKEFYRILQKYNGGEVLKMTLNKRCVIINDIPQPSQMGRIVVLIRVANCIQYLKLCS